jgi:polyisoprenoid-binding protein YceI
LGQPQVLPFDEVFMNVWKRQVCVAFVSLLAAGIAWAQPSLGGVKQQANKSKDSQQKKQNETAGETKEPVVFAMGPNEKCKFEVDSASKKNIMKFESKAPAETIESQVKKLTGYLELNPKKLDKVEGKFTVAWKDVDTGNPTRNGHMMGKDWVEADKYPDVVYTVTGIENASAPVKPVKSINCTLVGTMAMHGKEKEMKIPATLTYVESLPGKKGEPAHDGMVVKAKKFKVALADFDIKGKGGVVGNKVAGEQEFTVVSANMVGPEHKDKPKEAKAPPPKKPIKGG